MADVTFSGLPHELAVAPAAGDWLALDDVSEGETKKIHPATLLADNVVGPASATDNAVARYDLTTGKLIQDSLMTVDNSGSPNIPTGQTYKINGTAHTHALAAGATDVTASAAGVNAACDGDTAKNNHTHVGLVPYLLKTFHVAVIYVDATHVGVSLAGGYNQDSIAQEDLAKAGSGAHFSLALLGDVVTVEDGIYDEGDLPLGGVLSASVYTCKANGTTYWCEAYYSDGDLKFHFVDSGNNRLDLTSVGADLFFDVVISMILVV